MVERFVNNALGSGYSACLVWDKDFTDQPNHPNDALIMQWMLEFSSQNNQVLPPPPASPFAAFIHCLIRLFGQLSTSDNQLQEMLRLVQAKAA